MKQEFPGYYIKNNEFNKDWERAIFVFDSEVILKWFHLSCNNSIQLIDAISKSRIRLWLPYIIANEYHIRLHDEIEREIMVHYDIINRFKELKNRITQLDLRLFDKKVDEQNYYQLTENAIRHELKAVASLRNYLNTDNELNHKIADLFSGVVNSANDDPHPFTLQNKHITEDCTRVDFNNQPHNTNSSNENYITYEKLLYKSLLEKSKEDRSPIIYIVNSRKLHYMHYNQDKYLGLNPRLLTHFIKHTDGYRLHCCDFYTFLKSLNRKYKLSLSSGLLKQVKKLSQNDSDMNVIEMHNSWYE